MIPVGNNVRCGNICVHVVQYIRGLYSEAFQDKRRLTLYVPVSRQSFNNDTEAPIYSSSEELYTGRLDGFGLFLSVWRRPDDISSGVFRHYGWFALVYLVTVARLTAGHVAKFPRVLSCFSIIRPTGACVEGLEHVI